MEKVFYIKREKQRQVYQLDLSFFDTIMDYKYVLCLFTGDKHRNFIENCMSYHTAYDILYYYFFTRVDIEYNGFELFKKINKKIGPLGLSLFTQDLNECVEKVIYADYSPMNLNNYKI